MENNTSSSGDLGGQNAVALTGESVRYGVASGVDTAASNYSTAASLGFLGQLNYFFGEYGKGILFVLATTVFIFAIPAYLTKPERLHAVVGRAVKRSMDILGALVGLFLTVPFWVLIPILIKLDSRGSIFYRQTRVGENRRQNDRRYCQKTDVSDRRSRDRRRSDYFGRTFQVIKFRTMVQNAEKISGPVWAQKKDPRITRLGRFLRKTRLDEIPQFINILMGDMSLIGPRPERPHFVEDLDGKVENYRRRLEIKPGLTGLAQVSSGYDSSVASVAEKVAYDIEYIDNWSLWLDIKILLRTVVVVFTGRGAC